VTLTRVKVARNRPVLYSENESRNCATCHDATCDAVTLTTLMHDPLSRVKVASRDFVAGVTSV